MPEYMVFSIIDKENVILYNFTCLNGEVPEWLKGADCKSAAFRFVGSNPTLSTISRGGAVGSSSGS